MTNPFFRQFAMGMNKEIGDLASLLGSMVGLPSGGETGAVPPQQAAPPAQQPTMTPFAPPPTPNVWGAGQAAGPAPQQTTNVWPQGPVPAPPGVARGLDTPTGIQGAIYQGMIDRGLDPIFAAGMMPNIADESGFNLGIQEINPRGGKGGRGLIQLTGPRREEFERRYGPDGYTMDNQLDFLAWEALEGPESENYQRIVANSRTPGEAAAGIVTDFLRPAKEHQVSRSAKYLGTEGFGSYGPPPEGTVDTSKLEENLEDMSPEAKRKRKSGMMWMAIGKGLSQMSQGESVDLTDVLADYQERQDEMRERVNEVFMERRRQQENILGRKQEVYDIGTQRGYEGAVRAETREQDLIDAARERQEELVDITAERAYQDTVELRQRGYQLEDQKTSRGWTVEDATRERRESILDALRDRGWSDEDFEKNKTMRIDEAFLADQIGARREKITAAREAATAAERSQQIAETLRGTEYESMIPTLTEISPEQAEQTITALMGEDFKFQRTEAAAATERQRVREERHAAYGAAYGDQPYGKDIALIASMDPALADKRVEDIKAKEQVAIDLAKETAANERMAAIFANAGDQEAAQLAIAGKPKEASDLHLQKTGDAATGDTANWEYMRELPLEQQPGFIATIMAAQGAAPGLQTYMNVEEGRLTEEAKQLGSIREKRSVLSTAWKMANDPNFVSGPTSAWTLKIRKTLKESFGIDFQGTTQEEVFDALVQSSLGLQRISGEGSSTEADVERFEKGWISLSKTPEANKVLAAVLDKQLAKREARFFAEEDYIQAPGEKSAAGREEFVQQHMGKLAGDTLPEVSVDTIDSLIEQDMLEVGDPIYFKDPDTNEFRLTVIGEDGRPE